MTGPKKPGRTNISLDARDREHIGLIRAEAEALNMPMSRHDGAPSTQAVISLALAITAHLSRGDIEVLPTADLEDRAARAARDLLAALAAAGRPAMALPDPSALQLGLAPDLLAQRDAWRTAYMTLAERASDIIEALATAPGASGLGPIAAAWRLDRRDDGRDPPKPPPAAEREEAAPAAA